MPLPTGRISARNTRPSTTIRHRLFQHRSTACLAASTTSGGQRYAPGAASTIRLTIRLSAVSAIDSVALYSTLLQARSLGGVLRLRKVPMRRFLVRSAIPQFLQQFAPVDAVFVGRTHA